MEEQKTITLVNENGEQKEFEILMMINGEDQFGKTYIIVAPSEQLTDDFTGEIEMMTFSVEPDSEDATKGALTPVETPEEWAFINDVFGEFVKEQGGNVETTITEEGSVE